MFRHHPLPTPQPQCSNQCSDLYLAANAWAAKTGRDRDEFPTTPASTDCSDPTGTEWQEDELDALFPKLARKFG